jgi:hypothetical protein
MKAVCALNAKGLSMKMFDLPKGDLSRAENLLDVMMKGQNYPDDWFIAALLSQFFILHSAIKKLKCQINANIFPEFDTSNVRVIKFNRL